MTQSRNALKPIVNVVVGVAVFTVCAAALKWLLGIRYIPHAKVGLWKNSGHPWARSRRAESSRSTARRASRKVGRGPVLLTGALSALAWNFFFLPPRFTFV